MGVAIKKDYKIIHLYAIAIISFNMHVLHTSTCICCIMLLAYMMLVYFMFIIVQESALFIFYFFPQLCLTGGVLLVEPLLR